MVKMKTCDDEEYLVTMARSLRNTNPYVAKAWMITAKTLFPTNFSIQFEAYSIEKYKQNVNESAKYFSNMIRQFSNEALLWNEINAITTALCKPSNGDSDASSDFYLGLYATLPKLVRQEILLNSANHKRGTADYVEVMLVLFERFPDTIAHYGVDLVRVLMELDREQKEAGKSPSAAHRSLVMRLQPMLLLPAVELPEAVTLELLRKTLEYIVITSLPQDPGLVENNYANNLINGKDPWKFLFEVLEDVGKILGWSVTKGCSKLHPQSFLQQVIDYINENKGKFTVYDCASSQQTFFSLASIFFYSLNQYNSEINQSVNFKCSSNTISYILVEAFTSGSDEELAAQKCKKRRSIEEKEEKTPLITLWSKNKEKVLSTFLTACHSWREIHLSPVFQVEFQKIIELTYKQDLSILTSFNADFYLYHSLYDKSLTCLNMLLEEFQSNRKSSMVINKVLLRMVSIKFFLERRSEAVSTIIKIMLSLSKDHSTPSTYPKNRFSSLTQKTSKEHHFHFLQFNVENVILYCTKVLIQCYSAKSLNNISDNNVTLGHLMVLLQYSWPLEIDLFNMLLHHIAMKGSFSYPLFMSYVVNIEILEELMYLYSEQGGNVQLDILERDSCAGVTRERRVGTRGADKGVKEEFKVAMRRQVARSDTCMKKLMIDFITSQGQSLLDCL